MRHALAATAVGGGCGLTLFVAVFWLWMRYSGTDTLASF